MSAVTKITSPMKSASSPAMSRCIRRLFTDMNAMSMDANMTTDANMMMDANGAMMDANAMGPGGVDGNTATNTEQEMQKDQNTNAPDSNLANGL